MSYSLEGPWCQPMNCHQCRNSRLWRKKHSGLEYFPCPKGVGVAPAGVETTPPATPGPVVPPTFPTPDPEKMSRGREKAEKFCKAGCAHFKGVVEHEKWNLIAVSCTNPKCGCGARVAVTADERCPLGKW